MSSTTIKKVFNKQTFKFALALSIPAVITWCFLYSQQMADKEIQRVRKEFSAHPSSQHVVINNYTMYEMDEKNPRHWSLMASRGEMVDNNQVKLTQVKMEYYDKNQIKMKLIAPRGEANASTKYVRLSCDANSLVQAIGAEGKANLQAAQIELMKKNQFIATGGVTIVWPKVAKVTGDMAAGRIDLSDFKDFKIVGNTHAQIMVN